MVICQETSTFHFLCKNVMSIQELESYLIIIVPCTQNKHDNKQFDNDGECCVWLEHKSTYCFLKVCNQKFSKTGKACITFLDFYMVS